MEYDEGRAAGELTEAMSRRAAASRIFRAPERLYGTTFYPTGETLLYLPDSGAGAHARPVAPAAVFEGDIVVTGVVHSLDRAPRSPALETPAGTNTTDRAQNTTDAHMPGVYRDVHSARRGVCGPWFVGLRDRALYVTNENISLADFERLRAVCCVYPARPQCDGWTGVMLADPDTGDTPAMRARQAQIYDTPSLDLESARRRMDRSVYFEPPSRTPDLSGMPLVLWNMTEGVVWLERATLRVPPFDATPAMPAGVPRRATLVSAGIAFNASIQNLSRGVIADTGTFFFGGATYGFMAVPREEDVVFPVFGTSHRGGNCTEVALQGLRCLADSHRTHRCVQELHMPRARVCCGTLADAGIYVPCL